MKRYKMTAAVFCLIMLFGILGLGAVSDNGLRDLFALRASAESGTCGENLTWEYDEETCTLTISGTGDMRQLYYSTIDGVRVTSAPWRPYHNTIKNVVIEDGVTSVGMYAFCGCAEPNSIRISESVTNIGAGAFYGCTGLASITIPENITNIGDKAFFNCNIIETIYYDAKSVADFSKSSGAFYKAGTFGDGIKVIFGDCVKKIPKYLFYSDSSNYNPKIISVSISDSVQSIGDGAFLGCSELAEMTVGNGVESIGESAFAYCTTLKNIILPNGVRTINASAFEHCAITNVNIPNTVKSIGKEAFRGCTKLTEIAIPDSVTSVGLNAFFSCSGLLKITVDENNSVYHSYENCLIKTDSKSLIVGCNNSTIPNDGSVISIGDYAFNNRSGLTSIIIPEGVISMGNHAFDGCTGLTRITIPNSVTSLGYSVFAGCDRIKSAGPIGGGYDCEFGWTESIPYHAFYDCRSLSSITIPGSITAIGHQAFYNCGEITNITVEENNSVYHSDGNCLIETDSKTLVIGCKDGIIPDDGSVINIDNCAFSGCTSIVDISIPDCITNIGMDTFENCNIEYVEMGNGLTVIPKSLINRVSLKAFVIGNGVTAIEDYVFSGCEGLTSIVIPDSVTCIGTSAFSDCSNLETITIGEGVKSIGYNAFANCPKLSAVYFNAINADDAAEYNYYDPVNPERFAVEPAYPFCYSGREGGGLSVVFGDNVERIPGYLFAESNTVEPWEIDKKTNIKSLTIGSKVKEIGRGAFMSENVTASVVIPDSVTDIQPMAFAGCRYLTDLTLGSGVKNIGYGAFNFCWISVIEFPEGLETIGDHAFYAAQFTELRIPGSVKTIEIGAITGAPNLETITVDSSNTVYYSSGNCVIEKESGKLIFGCKNSVIPDDGSITEICERAFYSCLYMESVKIPYGITTISLMSFAMSGLNRVYIPASVTKIEGAAFEYEYYLTDPSVLEDVYYGGSEDDWNKIEFETEYVYDNTPYSDPNCHRNLLNANIHFNCTDMHSHVYSEEIEKQPSCSEEGLKRFTCSCGKSYTEPIEKLSHTAEIVSIPATCAEPGVEYTVCSVCGEKLSEETEIPATGIHPWTYKLVGNTVLINCETCSESYSVTAVLPENPKCSDTAKEITIYGKAPEGFVTRIVYETSDGLAPKMFGEYNAHVDVKPSDNSDYVAVQMDFVLRIEHDLVFCEGKPVTCTEAGYEPYESCQYCDYSTYALIPATGHDYVHYYDWSDDGKSCVATAICANDPSHRFSDEATVTSSIKYEPTCLEYGTTAYTASFTNDFFLTQVKNVDDIPPKQHNYVASYEWSDDGKSCVAKAVCTNDPFHKFSEEAAITSAVKTKPTCEEKGTTTYTASFNNKFFVAQTKDVVDIPANGHTEIIKNVVDPTCTVPGYSGTVFCSVCNEPLREGNEIPPLGHSFTNYVYNNDATTERDGTETAKCNRCNETDTRTKSGTKITNPTANVNINVAKATSVDYKTKVTIKASATNLDPAYHLVLCVNGNEYEGNNREVACDYGEITGDIVYSVKIVDEKGNVQRDANGAELKKDGGRITCNAGFFQKLIAFFRTLFGSLPAVTVKP